MLELGVKFLISYFIGSLMGPIIVGKLRGGVDIRTMGSGNAGGTNALRTQGILFALGVVIIDIGKGFVGAGIVPGLELPYVPVRPRRFEHMADAVLLDGGHIWPCLADLSSLPGRQGRSDIHRYPYCSCRDADFAAAGCLGDRCCCLAATWALQRWQRL